MIFSSLSFLFYFFPIVLTLYYLFYFSKTLKNALLLISSLLFYTWGEPKYILLLLASIIFNYLLGLLIGQAKKKKRLFWLVIALIFNLSTLFIFKYLTFITKNISDATAGKTEVINIALPIGISFFTFQAISYVVDVYRRDVGVQKNFLHLALYLSFFPKLTQGPVMKYATFEPQIMGRKETLKKFSSGVCFFITGLGKKVLLANNMAIVVDRIFEIHKMGNIPVSLAWLGALGYTFQIYFDFSGYSDMAIGLGLMFGFKLDKNFNYPYISKSISEFWRRWHITLGAWFRDYLYIPLGGSRVINRDKLIRNLAVVWIATGVWHGANWTFLVWGVINFVFIALERMFQFEQSKIPNILRHVYAMLIVIIGWVIFRSDSLEEAGSYIGCMFNIFNGFYSDYTYMFLKEFWLFLIAAIVFSLPLATIVNQFMVKGILVRKTIDTKPPYDGKSIYVEPPLVKIISVLYPVGMLVLFLICVAYMVKGSYNPFIYFQF
ncbi:alginate O-acetyltransferase complex protein AlgI [Lachnotalea glycerini]|uniref:Alginate O-acetyltransferase complex protein AlgI n=1 Tax=Lachnotalea glycerini TaxID=1763509 RepID=A0A318EQF3_9FIRM|nr:MBOAT family protein [Lachnotalea glycerini]PXV88310.1 alginate O-acetyltransferase complex protein AlgI [Lachnotalea glycerini]